MSSLFRTDFHVHTNVSRECGHPDAHPEAMVAAAREAGLEALGLSDHIYTPAHLGRPREVRARLPQQREGMPIYIGCEADVISPTDIVIDAVYAETLDYVLLSASHLFEPGTYHPVTEFGVREMAAYMVAGMRLAVACGFCDIVVHPFRDSGGPFSFGELVEAVDPEAITALAAEAARAGVAMEYNPRELHSFPEQAQWLYGRFLDAGVKLSINSDAHRPSKVGCRGPEFATEAQLRAAGVREEMRWRIEDGYRRRGRARKS